MFKGLLLTASVVTSWFIQASASAGIICSGQIKSDPVYRHPYVVEYFQNGSYTHYSLTIFGPSDSYISTKTSTGTIHPERGPDLILTEYSGFEPFEPGFPTADTVTKKPVRIGVVQRLNHEPVKLIVNFNARPISGESTAPIIVEIPLRCRNVSASID